MNILKICTLYCRQNIIEDTDLFRDKAVNKMIFKESTSKYIVIDSPLERRPSVGCLYPGGYSHTHVLMGSTNQTQGY